MHMSAQQTEKQGLHADHIAMSTSPIAMLEQGYTPKSVNYCLHKKEERLEAEHMAPSNHTNIALQRHGGMFLYSSTDVLFL